MDTPSISLACGTLTRVSYVDALVPPELAGLDSHDLNVVSWSTPLWSENDRLRVGLAAWFAELAGKRVVFDPVLATDAFLRADRQTERAQQTAFAERFATAGFPRDSIDLVVLSHFDGIGMVAWRDDHGMWSPFFPKARILVSDRGLSAFLERAESSEEALGPAAVIERESATALIAQGAVEVFHDRDAILPGLTAAVSNGHGPGHALMHFGEDPSRPAVSMIGHLALSPLHLIKGECPQQHLDAATAWTALRDVAADGRILVGPLWPAPGYGRWRGDRFEAGI